MDYEKAYKKALETARDFLDFYKDNPVQAQKFIDIFPELAESEDERIIRAIIDALYSHTNSINLLSSRGYQMGDIEAYLEKQKENIEKEYVFRPLAGTDIKTAALQAIRRANQRGMLVLAFNGAYIPVRKGCNANKIVDIYEAFIEKQKEQKPTKMEIYEVGKGTTICGQDYKCKKDYKAGNCWYIKNVIYHCSRDGYLNDQNGVSWSCTPEWFNEYIYTNSEWAEEEKTRFVSGQFLQCELSFDDFKEGEHYWLEYVGDDMYVGRSDNILNQKFHITPRQLFTLFSQQLEEVQGPPQEEKQVSLNYEPPFNENPSDIEIIDALIHSLNEQDGFLTAIDCVSTKAILRWLEKQKEQKPEDKEIILTNFEEVLNTFLFDFANSPIEDCEPKEYTKKHSAEILKAAYTELNAQLKQDIFEAQQEGRREGYEAAKAEQKPAEWSEDYREEDIQTRFAFYTYKDDPSTLYLSNVFVEEASRNHGFGTRILKAAEKVAETIGATTISLKVKQDSPANAWYRKNGYGYVAFEDGYDWLEKNLEYMKPNKQEWSEEDEKMIERLITRLNWITYNTRTDGTSPNITFLEEIDWLKSLRPQPHWKPSEEQMEALRKSIEKMTLPCGNKALETLYEDLRKLM